MTPDAAQQRGVLAYGQCQHDGKDSCSKHVVLATDHGKSCASTSKGRSQEILGFWAGELLRDEAPCGISPMGAENSAVQRQAASETVGNAGTAAVLDAGGTPAWIYLAGAVAIGLALLFVILHLTGFSPTHH